MSLYAMLLLACKGMGGMGCQIKDGAQAERSDLMGQIYRRKALQHQMLHWQPPASCNLIYFG